MSNEREIIFPTRFSQIQKVTKPKQFDTPEGDTLYGVIVTMQNGDTFSYWTDDQFKLELFKVGELLIYNMKRVIVNEGTDNEQVRHKLASYDFKLPRKTRFETKVVDMISYVIKDSAILAKDIYIGTNSKNKNWDIDEYTQIYNDIYNLLKHRYLNEDFERNEVI